MIFNKRKNRFKPLYKQLVRLRENAQNREKVFKFKKKKWVKFISYLNKKSRIYNRYKPQKQDKYTVSKDPNKWDSYAKGRYRNTLYIYKRFKLLYGDFNKKKIKKSIKQVLTDKINLKLTFLKIFENRLDTVLFRSKFSKSVRSARQLISHGQVLVNKKKVVSKNYFLKPGDLISIDRGYKKFIEKNIKSSATLPIPPKHLSINYKTMQIILGTFNNVNNLSNCFNFNLKLEKLLMDYYRF